MVEHFTVPNPLPGQDGQNGAAVAPDLGLADQDFNKAAQTGAPAELNDGIAGMSALRGLMLYGAVLTFAGLYTYFMVVISTSRHGVKPTIGAALISAAAALSGVLGSAFALKIGVPPHPSLVNRGLAAHQKAADANGVGLKVTAFVRQVLSVEPSDVNSKSWPLTFGIWAYAVVAAAVAVVYILHQKETPDAVKALAVTFGGYVIGLVNMAYGMTKHANG